MTVYIAGTQKKTHISRTSCGETRIKSTHACFLSTHLYTRTYADLSDYLPSSGSDKKFKGTSLFKYTLTPTKYIKNDIPNKVHVCI